MSSEISYFEAASYLASIESEHAEQTDPVERTASLVERLQKKWPGLSIDQAVAYVRLFSGAE